MPTSSNDVTKNRPSNGEPQNHYYPPQNGEYSLADLSQSARMSHIVPNASSYVRPFLDDIYIIHQVIAPLFNPPPIRHAHQRHGLQFVLFASMALVIAVYSAPVTHSYLFLSHSISRIQCRE